MNRQEFGTWWEDFEIRFPQKANWFSNEGMATVETWFEILAPCELADTLAANKRFQDASAEWPSNWERFPVAVRDEAAKCRSRRLSVEHRSTTPDEVLDRDGNGACGLCHGYGMVIREDERRRCNAFRCVCPAGDKWSRQVTYAKNGKEGPLLAPFKVNRYSEFDDFNAA